VPEEGVRYAEEAVKAAQGPYASLKGKALHVLGVNLGLQARESRSDSERSGLQNRAVEVLREAVSTEPGEFAPRYDLAVQLAEMRRIRQAMEQVGDALEVSNGAHADSWRLLALLLTSEQRYSAAEEAIAVALESGPGRGEQVGLLRTLASVQRAGGDRKQALNTLSRVLGLEKRRGGRAEPLVEAGLLSELAEVNVDLKEWGNAEEFLKRAKAVEPYHGGAWYASGRMLEAQGKAQEAMTAYETAAAADPADVRSLLRVRSGILCLSACLSRIYVTQSVSWGRELDNVPS
jgi:tetratricopeptide (TPR) repeat protein